MTSRPADEARRALRAARDRAPQPPTPTPPPPPTADQETPRPGDVAREALRRAVSEYRGSGRGGDDGVSGQGVAENAGAFEDARAPEDPAAPEDAQEVGTPPEPAGPGDRQEGRTGAVPADAHPGEEAEQASTDCRDTDGPGPRAADVAREALRAARDDARRAREETEREGARRRRRARQSAVDDRAAAARRAREHGAGGSVRDVGQLLSGAFRLPGLPDTTPDDRPDATPGGQPGATPYTLEETTGHGSPSSHLSDLLHGPAITAPERTDSEAHPGFANEADDQEPWGSGPVSGDHVSQDPASEPGDPASEPGDPVSESGSPGSKFGAPASQPSVPAFDPPSDAPESGPPSEPAPTSVSTRSTPHTAPRSMAAPHRDSDLRRTFPPFPAREGKTFAESWWGNAWVGALEQGALDAKRLERGRGYAEQGHVDAITVTPGLVLAYVRGSRPRPYRVQLRLRTLGDTDWDRFLDAAADRPGHIAALLDKEMPQSLADCGVPLLPGPGDLEPRCSCPDRGHPCKHAAALCYQTARLLDADPFVLLLLRGRGERELLDALSRLSATRAARAAQDREPAPTPGVRASDVLAPRTLPPLPAPLPAPPHPEQPPAYPAAPGGPDPFALDQLATDAAARAHALLTTGRDPVGQLTLWQDAVRLAAARPGSGLTAGTRALYSSLAAAAGRTPSDLARAVAAWRQGGLEGLAVLEEPWDPPAGRFDRARPLLLAADLPAFRPWRNHLTHPRGHVQLRLGRDGLWYAYESEPGQDDWWPRGTPDLDPVGALTGLGFSGEL
ncbi:SWIM zinc finger family protein [Streptomyces sp. NPDC000877]|uniref:SWIM zinc finger family protein n=1 Tax=unclassified Streptomyces TaxID=2593676 RepID=UPI003327C45F